MKEDEYVKYVLRRYVRREVIVVLGPQGSGKSTFIKNVSCVYDSISVKSFLWEIGEYESTLAYDHGIVYLKNNSLLKTICLEEAKKMVLENKHSKLIRVDLWGSAGQLHLKPARKTIIYPKAKTVLFFVDLSRPKTLEEAKILLEEAYNEINGLKRGLIPLILFLNKDDIRKVDYQFFPRKLGLERSKIIIGIAKDPKKAREALTKVIHHLLNYHKYDIPSKILK